MWLPGLPNTHTPSAEVSQMTAVVWKNCFRPPEFARNPSSSNGTALPVRWLQSPWINGIQIRLSHSLKSRGRTPSPSSEPPVATSKASMT